jgi:hypothetical protein
MGVSAVFAVIGAVGARKQKKDARKQQKRAEKISGRRADIQNAKANRRRLSEARRLRAQTIAAGEGAGLTGSSGVAGATGSVQTQTATNISFQNQLSGLDEARFDALGKANDALGKAATFQAVGNLGQQLGEGSFGQQFSQASESVKSFFNK